MSMDIEHETGLAGTAASILSKLDTKAIREILESTGPELLTARGEYSTRALLKLLELADEFQKEFAQTASEKFPGMPLSAERK